MAGGPDVSVKLKSAERDQAEYQYDTWSQLARNILIISVVSIITWAFVSLVREGIHLGYEATMGVFEEAGEGESQHELNYYMWIAFAVLMAGAVVRTLLLQLPGWKQYQGDGMGTALESIHASYDEDPNATPERYKQDTFLGAIKRAVLTVLTVGTGCSGGIEAPVFPIGESIGAGFSKVFGTFSREDIRLFQIAGIAAAVSTLLEAPFTAALFAAEVIYHGRVLYRTLTYSLLAAIIAYAFNNHFLDVQPLFTADHHPHSYTPIEYLDIAAVAFICCTPAALLLGWTFKKVKAFFKVIPNIMRPIVGALGTGAIALALWFGFHISPQHILGVSEETIALVISGEGEDYLELWWVLGLLVVGKILATAFTLVGGGSAGMLVPAMYIGALSGAMVYHLLAMYGLDLSGHVSLYVVAGLASALVAIASVPMAAIALVLEVFGASYGPPAIVACVLTYKLSRRYQLYSQQNNS